MDKNYAIFEAIKQLKLVITIRIGHFQNYTEWNFFFRKEIAWG